MNKTFLTQLNWRFATKKFKKEEKIQDKDIEKILEAIQFAPSSYGIQPYHVYVISDDDIRSKMKKFSYLQPQVTDSQYLLVFCSDNDIKGRVSGYIDVAVAEKGFNRTKMLPFSTMVKGSFLGKSNASKSTWSAKQAYLALGFALAACAELGIDSCPMEGFIPKKIGKVLGVPKNICPVAYLAIGYRASDPERPKVRFPKSDLFTFI